MTEATIQAGIQDTIQAMTEFANADVVINDWGIFDQTSSKAPYVLIQTADEFRSRHDLGAPENIYHIPVMLVEVFTDWPETMNGLTTRRDALLTTYNTGGNQRSAGGIPVTIDEIRPQGPIAFIYDPSIPDNQLAEALPIFVAQTLIFEVKEWA